MKILAIKEKKLEKGERMEIKICEEEQQENLIKRGYKIIKLVEEKVIHIDIISSWLHKEIFVI